ncbi:MAG: twin-arginine translocase TatA/TatE family subunit [Tepidisphaeraceae bacterium]
MNLLALAMPGPFEMILLAGLGLLFFGKRLPDVGRSIGQTVVQFKKGLNEVTEEMNKPSAEKKEETTGYKFDPHTGKPIEQ